MRHLTNRVSKVQENEEARTARKIFRLVVQSENSKFFGFLLHESPNLEAMINNPDLNLYFKAFSSYVIKSEQKYGKQTLLNFSTLKPFEPLFMVLLTLSILSVFYL